LILSPTIQRNSLTILESPKESFSPVKISMPTKDSPSNLSKLDLIRK